MSILSLVNVCCFHGAKPLLDNLSMEFESGKLYCVSSETALEEKLLLAMLAGMADPRCGSVNYKGRDLRGVDKDMYRRRGVGVVYPHHNLMDHYTVKENILLTLRGVDADANKVEVLLEQVGLSPEDGKCPARKLTSINRKRAELARALANDSGILVVTHPTEELTQEESAELLELLKKLAVDGLCVILLDKSAEASEIADECYTLRSGAAVSGAC